MKLKSIIIASAALIIAAACTDLEEENYSFVPASEYGTTPDEIKTIAGGAYASLRGGQYGGTNCSPASEYVFFLVECVSDEFCVPTRGSDWDDGGRYQEAQNHDFEPDNALVLSGWKYCYTGIASCNFVIAAIEEGGMSEEETKAATAEIRGIRAYYYYLLLDWFGNVPISTSFPEEESPGNSPRADVYDFVESELLDIVDYLQEDIEYGRFTQNVCNTLLARLYINSEAYIGTARWQDCIDACDKVTGYTLTANTLDNFVTENQYSPEIIWSIPYDRVEGTWGNYFASLTFHYNHWQTISSSVSNWTWSVNGPCAQPGLYSSFEEGDERIACLCEGPQLRPNGDPVLERDNVTPLVYTEEIENYYEAGEGEGCRIQKYEVIFGEMGERDYDLVLMRYAEILMMKAECYVRLNNAAAARPLVSQIRERSGLSTTPDPVTLEVIDDEWLHEFAFEGLRRSVNVRFGTYFDPGWPEYTSTPQNKGIFPIPQTELDINSNLQQNPGY